jgi:protein-tyrosine phosphatase
VVQHVFWLRPFLAGRPGPDRAHWDLAALRRAGIGAVLSVNDGVLCHPENFEALDLAYACVPLPEDAPPRPGDVERCLEALATGHTFVCAQRALGRATLVHCSAGKDRTGLFLAHSLVRETGCSAADAIAEVRRVRAIALTAPGWEALARDVLERVSVPRPFA